MASRIPAGRWTQDFLEAIQYGRSLLVSLWKDCLLPLLSTAWVFLAILGPLLLVVLVLWYLDSSGFRAGPGFYTIQ